jgi:H+-translocating NAD(P) transhydrogenase subunit beta
VKMTAMPQMVAAFNGVGGGAAALVAVSEFHRVHALGHGQKAFVGTLSILFSVVIGGISFSGSAVAFAKLQGLWPRRLETFPMQSLLNAAIFLCAFVLSVLVLSGGLDSTGTVAVVLGLAAVLGVLLVMPIGGADMPIVISLLNAFTGLAAASSGFTLQNYVLVISGALVGASGTILTQLMSHSLGRSLPKILFGALGAGKAEAEAEEEEEKPVRSASADDVASLLSYDADSIILVPGYGLAAAQAQTAMASLMEALESKGKEVRFAIHPVAGRMPGHMNVLLAEADVPYDRLVDLEDINDDFQETDAVVVVGANDVVNPKAQEEGDSPISGMPVLNVSQAKQVVFIKRSLSPGFAGIDNPLFYDRDKTMMLFSDARAGLEELVDSVKKS